MLLIYFYSHPVYKNNSVTVQWSFSILPSRKWVLLSNCRLNSERLIGSESVTKTMMSWSLLLEDFPDQNRVGSAFGLFLNQTHQLIQNFLVSAPDGSNLRTQKRPLMSHGSATYERDETIKQFTQSKSQPSVLCRLFTETESKLTLY